MLALYCDTVRNGLGTQVIANHGLLRRTTSVCTGGTRSLSTALLPIEKQTKNPIKIQIQHTFPGYSQNYVSYIIFMQLIFYLKVK